MTFAELTIAVRDRVAPADLTPVLRALWLDATGDWDAAHSLAGTIESPEGARVHAYLHRKEGALPNARYWYKQAGRAPFDGTLEDEWADLARELLSVSDP